jgi:hypothetical protein
VCSMKWITRRWPLPLDCASQLLRDVGINPLFLDIGNGSRYLEESYW